MGPYLLETNARGQINQFTIDSGTPFKLIQQVGNLQAFPLNALAEFDRNEFRSNEFGFTKIRKLGAEPCAP